MTRAIRIFETPDDLARAAADRFLELYEQKHSAGEPFTVALAGGRTPAVMYGLLAEPPYTTLDWEAIHLFFGDERCVAPDSSDSNFQMLQTSLLSKTPNPIHNVHRIPADLPDHDLAAQQYAEDLQRFFKLQPGQLPRFDLILLGMGPDGHTASLFPHKPALHEQHRLAVATEPGMQPYVTRVTLTYPVLNNAANVLFLVDKADKADKVAAILEGQADFDALPAQAVQPTNGTLTWFLDQAAAANLKNK